MALRFLLVGLVIGLGVELPDGDEVVSWARAGGEWLQARIDDAFGADAVAAAETTSDAEFAAIVDRMAGAFAADLALADRPAASDRLTFEPIAVPDDPEPGLAFALNRASQGEGVIPEPALPEVVDAPGSLPAAGRLASAVRLTREAASAWMNVLLGAEAAVRVR